MASGGARGNHGGGRNGGGRPKGAHNRSVKGMAAEAILKGRKTPLEYLVNIYCNIKESKERRLDAAKASLPYFHPRLSIREITGIDGGPITMAEARVEIVAAIPHNGRESDHDGKVIPLRLRREA